MNIINLNHQDLLKEKQTILDFLTEPNSYNDPSFNTKSRRLKELDNILMLAEQQTLLLAQLQEANNLADDPELGTVAQEEINNIQQQLETLNQQITQELLPKDPNDTKNAIVEIRAGVGGDEASLFAGDLLRMYLRFCEISSLKTELLSESQNDSNGYKEVVFIVKGDGPYGLLKFESGVHRVQRIPSTESQGRIHTSTATVAVLPEAEESDIEINPSDIRVDVYRSSGCGGQSVNTTDSAVRITHLPTGIVVSNQDEKSQIKNRLKALGILRSRLLQQKLDEEASKLSNQRRSLIGSGARSEKIRTYNFPQDRITDHRINYSRGNIPGALSGDISDLIEELHNYEQKLQIEQLNS